MNSRFVSKTRAEKTNDHTNNDDFSNRTNPCDFYPRRLCRSAWVGFSSPFVCLFVRSITQKQMRVQGTTLVTRSGMLLGLKGQRSRSQVNKPFCILGCTRSSSLITIARLPSSSFLKITNRSFRYASPSLWNNLPASLRQPRSSVMTTIPSITSSLFHSRLKTHMFHKSFPPSPTHRTAHWTSTGLPSRTSYHSALCFSSSVIYF